MKAYVAARNTVDHAVDKARESFENELARNVKSNSKGFWSYVKSKTTS